ncbi:MAG: hypothetical protein AAGU17_12710 [Anaerolineaceae bacterium]
MTQQELLRWWELLTNEDIKNKFVGFESDYRELIQLNHRVMEQVHEIHNNNMLRKDKQI